MNWKKDRSNILTTTSRIFKKVNSFNYYFKVSQVLIRSEKFELSSKLKF